MPEEISKEEIRVRVKTIRAIYQEYLTELNDLKKQQTKIIDEFMKKLEQRKIEEIKETLKDSQ